MSEYQDIDPARLHASRAAMSFLDDRSVKGIKYNIVDGIADMSGIPQGQILMRMYFSRGVLENSPRVATFPGPVSVDRSITDEIARRFFDEVREGDFYRRSIAATSFLATVYGFDAHVFNSGLNLQDERGRILRGSKAPIAILGLYSRNNQIQIGLATPDFILPQTALKQIDEEF